MNSDTNILEVMSNCFGDIRYFSVTPETPIKHILYEHLYDFNGKYPSDKYLNKLSYIFHDIQIKGIVNTERISENFKVNAFMLKKNEFNKTFKELGIKGDLCIMIKYLFFNICLFNICLFNIYLFIYFCFFYF